jgi:hypothetical protein
MGEGNRRIRQDERDEQDGEGNLNRRTGKGEKVCVGPKGDPAFF